MAGRPRCYPCWYAAKKLLKNKPTKLTSADADLDDGDDDVFALDDLEEDEIKYRSSVSVLGRLFWSTVQRIQWGLLPWLPYRFPSPYRSPSTL